VLVQLTVNQPAGPKKDQASVHYRDGSGNKDCGGCSMVRIMPPDFETLTCTAVKGPIREDGVCDIWAPSPEDGALHKLTSAQVENALVALAKSYERVEHGRVEQVSGYNSRAKLDAAIKSGLFSVSRGPAVPAKPEPKAPDRGLARAGSELPLERKPSRFACIDCKRETTSTKPGALTENYSVHNRVWAAAGNPNGHLCIGCMEKRLGRKLTGADFPDMPVNNLANSDNPRLAWSYRTARLKELLKDHPSSERTKLHLTSAQIENALLALTTVDPYKRVVAGKMQIVRSYDRKQGRFVDVLGHRH
jgi:hypothetical protein